MAKTREYTGLEGQLKDIRPSTGDFMQLRSGILNSSRKFGGYLVIWTSTKVLLSMESPQNEDFSRDNSQWYDLKDFRYIDVFSREIQRPSRTGRGLGERRKTDEVR